MKTRKVKKKRGGVGYSRTPNFTQYDISDSLSLAFYNSHFQGFDSLNLIQRKQCTNYKFLKTTNSLDQAMPFITNL